MNISFEETTNFCKKQESHVLCRKKLKHSRFLDGIYKIKLFINWHKLNSFHFVQHRNSNLYSNRLFRDRLVCFNLIFMLRGKG